MPDPRQFGILQSSRGWREPMQFDRLKRREFISLLGAAAAAWPRAACAGAQSYAADRRAGSFGKRAGPAEATRGISRGMAALGWVPGRNVEIAYQWHGGDTGGRKRSRKSWWRFVRTSSWPTSLTAIRQATSTIPIVFIVADPVGQGLVPSLARPGGNMTGFGLEEPSLGAKWVELLKEIAPRAARAAIIFNPETAPYARMFLPSMEAA